jgi:RNA polymerase sigma-70 factor (ECF subfamily)
VNYSDLSPPELFAACARGGDADSWQEFIRRFNPVIARGVLRVVMQHGAPDKALIDDLLQETYLKLCANDCRLLRNFVPHDPQSAFGFMKVVATSVARDFFKSRYAEKRAPEATALSLAPESGTEPRCREDGLDLAERAVLIDQIDKRLKTLVPIRELAKARTVFWLYYRSGLTASAIASMPGSELTTKGVESLLFRLTRSIREGLADPGTLEPNGEKGFARLIRYREGAK